MTRFASLAVLAFTCATSEPPCAWPDGPVAAYEAADEDSELADWLCCVGDDADSATAWTCADAVRRDHSPAWPTPSI